MQLRGTSPTDRHGIGQAQKFAGFWRAFENTGVEDRQACGTIRNLSSKALRNFDCLSDAATSRYQPGTSGLVPR